MTLRQWTLNVLIAADDLLNAALRGKPGETLSARAMTAKRDGRLWGVALYAILDWLEPGHCEAAVQNDIARADAVERDLRGER